MKFKKNKKVTKGAFGWFSSLNPDAGDVEYNNKVFNNSTNITNNSNNSSTSNNTGNNTLSSGSGMGEDINNNGKENISMKFKTDTLLKESSWAENSYSWSKSRQPKVDAIFEAGLWEDFEDAVLEASDIVVGLHTDIYHIQNNAARTEPPYITGADIKEAKNIIFKLCDEYYEKAIAQNSKLEESAKHLDTDYQKKNIIDYYEMVIDPYGDLQSSFESEDEYRQSLMNQLSDVNYIDEWIDQYSDESGFVEMLKELKATIIDNSSTVEESVEHIDNNNDNNALTTYYQVYSKYESDDKPVFIDEFEYMKDALEEALYHMDQGSQVKIFVVEEDEDGNVVGKRKEILIYSDDAIQDWSDSDFDVASAQEASDMFGKPVYASKEDKVYYPKMREYIESDEHVELEAELRNALKEYKFVLNTDECTPEDAVEYILQVRKDSDPNYSVVQWLDDTWENYPECFIEDETLEEDVQLIDDNVSYTVEYGLNNNKEFEYLDNLSRDEVRNIANDILSSNEYDYVYVSKRSTYVVDGHYENEFEDILDAYLDNGTWIANIDKMHLIDNSNLTIDNM